MLVCVCVCVCVLVCACTRGMHSNWFAGDADQHRVALCGARGRLHVSLRHHAKVCLHARVVVMPILLTFLTHKHTRTHTHTHTHTASPQSYLERHLLGLYSLGTVLSPACCVGASDCHPANTHRRHRPTSAGVLTRHRCWCRLGSSGNPCGSCVCVCV
jgi:hypothetical protein